MSRRRRHRSERREANLAGFMAPNMTAPGSPRYITPWLAENLATVSAAIQAIAGTIATLPAAVYRIEGEDRIETRTHPVAHLIREPNTRQTWPELIEGFAGECLAFGNSLLTVEWDRAGRPTALTPAPWPTVSPMLLANNQLAFDVVAQAGWRSWTSTTGLPRRYLQDEVVLLKDRTDDGLLGRSRLSRAPGAVENALGLQDFSNGMWRNGTMPAGTLTHPKTLSDPARKRMKAELEDFRGVSNARRLLLLEEGLQYSAMGVAPEQAEVLNSRRFSVEEIARLYGVPPPILQDYSRNTFTNAATAGAWFGQFTIVPWVRKIEAAFTKTLLPDPRFEFCIDVSGLMRGDFAQRWNANVAAVANGILTPNEVRLAEGWNRHPEGDVLRTLPGANVPAAPAGNPAPRQPVPS